MVIAELGKGSRGTSGYPHRSDAGGCTRSASGAGIPDRSKTEGRDREAARRRRGNKHLGGGDEPGTFVPTIQLSVLGRTVMYGCVFPTSMGGACITGMQPIPCQSSVAQRVPGVGRVLINDLKSATAGAAGGSRIIHAPAAFPRNKGAGRRESDPR